MDEGSEEDRNRDQETADNSLFNRVMRFDADPLHAAEARGQLNNV